MVKTYSAITLKRLLREHTAGYRRELQAQRAQIERLCAENKALKTRIKEMSGKQEEIGELDMEQILRPDPALRLDNLCRELGVMDNEESD